MLMPPSKLLANAAPMVKPSTKLWRPSPTITIHATERITPSSVADASVAAGARFLSNRPFLAWEEKEQLAELQNLDGSLCPLSIAQKPIVHCIIIRRDRQLGRQGGCTACKVPSHYRHQSTRVLGAVGSKAYSWGDAGHDHITMKHWV